MAKPIAQIPEFDLNQKVRVRLFDMVTEGIITKRVAYETNMGSQIRYDVYIESIEDCVCPWEDSLLELNPIEQNDQKTSA